MVRFTRQMLVSLRSLLVGAVMLAGVSLYAQGDVSTTLLDQRMVIIPTRNISEIASDIDDAGRAKKVAMDRKAQAQNHLKEVEGAIEMKKATLKESDRRKDEAKKAKRDTEAAALQLESDAHQQAIDLLNRLKDLRNAEIDEADARGKLADAETRLYQQETELQKKRIEYDSLKAAGVSDLTKTTAQNVLRELEVRFLKAQEDQAGATESVASKQKDIIGKRIKLHESLTKVGMPRE